MKRLEEEEIKRKRIDKKKKMESRFEMVKWIHNFIAENSKVWEEERLKRIENRRAKIEEWEKKSRFEKIAVLKKKFENRVKDVLLERKTVCEEEDDMLVRILEEEQEKELTWNGWRRNKEEIEEVEMATIDEEDSEDSEQQEEKQEKKEENEVFEEEDEAVLLHELNRVEGQSVQALEEHVQCTAGSSRA